VGGEVTQKRVWLEGFLLKCHLGRFSGGFLVDFWWFFGELFVDFLWILVDFGRFVMDSGRFWSF